VVVISDESRLIGELMYRYRKIGKVARPVLNSSMPVEVRLSVMLYQLVNVDEHEQFITLKLWIHMVSTQLLYPPSEWTETGGYTVFTFVCLCVCVCVCVCAHSFEWAE